RSRGGQGVQQRNLAAGDAQQQPGVFNFDECDVGARAQALRAEHANGLLSARLCPAGPPGGPGTDEDQRNDENQADNQAKDTLVGHGGNQRRLLSRLMRSDGVMMSVTRMPYFSSTTTTSPWAIRYPFT